MSKALSLNNFLELLQVQVIFRHGARTPLHHIVSGVVPEARWEPHLEADVSPSPYPFEIIDICSKGHMQLPPQYPNSCRLPGGLYTGEFVKSGQEDAVHLGKRLKKLYVDGQMFLSRTFSSSEVYARSTYIRRTIKSLIFLTAGMFGDSYHENQRTESLRILTDTIEREFLFPIPFGKIYREGLKECAHSKRHLAMKQNLKRVLCVDRLIDDLLPVQCNRDCPIYYVRDDYIARQHSGFPIPSGLIELLPEIDRLSTEELQWELLGKQSEWYTNMPVVFGPMLRMIVCNMENYLSLPKFHLYSCHDSTLVVLLIALRCSFGTWPPFCADVIFELYRWKNVIKKRPEAADDPCPSLSDDEDNAVNTNDEFETPPDWPQFWLRILYLGEPVNLGCLWKLPYMKGVDFTEGFIPLSSLLNLWSEWLERYNSTSENDSNAVKP